MKRQRGERQRGEGSGTEERAQLVCCLALSERARGALLSACAGGVPLPQLVSDIVERWAE